MDNHYVSNELFTKAVVEYSRLVKKTKKNRQTPPKVTDFIGECILKICRNLATSPEFSGYSYKDEMIEDGILQCLNAVNNCSYDHKKGTAFSYFTQVSRGAFYRRKEKEKNIRALEMLSVMETNPDQAPDIYSDLDDSTKKRCGEIYAKAQETEKRWRERNLYDIEYKGKVYKDTNLNRLRIELGVCFRTVKKYAKIVSGGDEEA